MKKKIFISGPMTGIEHFNKPAFDAAEEMLKSKGYSVFNPSWMSFDENWSREEKSHIDFAIIDVCDAIYQLPGWRESRGAMMEYEYAMSQSKEIIEEEPEI